MKIFENYAHETPLQRNKYYVYVAAILFVLAYFLPLHSEYNCDINKWNNFNPTEGCTKHYIFGFKSGFWYVNLFSGALVVFLISSWNQFIKRKFVYYLVLYYYPMLIGYSIIFSKYGFTESELPFSHLIGFYLLVLGTTLLFFRAIVFAYRYPN